MASLTGNLVAETYKALLKTIDNDILTASEKQITDGFGGGSNVFIDSNGFLRANKYKVTNGLATQFLKADGSLDANTYLTSINSSQIIAALGFTPVTNARTLTINGTTYDLSANRSWTIAGTSAVWGNISGTLSNQTDLQTALNAKFNNPTGTISQYIRGDGSIATFPTLPGGLPIGGTTGQILAKINATDYNTEWIDNFATQTKNEVKLGQTLTKGKAVYVSSANGTNIIVSAASNVSEALSSKTFGLLETGGATNAFVKCVTFGLLAGLDTSTATAGDPVWLGVNGALIFGLANKPYAPAHLVYIGVVTRVQSNNGEIFVNVQNGFELKELHDVAVQTPSNNDGLFFETATSLWKNKSIATVLGYTPQAQLSGTGFVKASGTTISYDNSTYLTTTDAASTYQRLDKMVSNLLASATEYPNSNAVIAALALKADAANPVFTGNMTISGAEPKLTFTDTDQNPDYFIGVDAGFFRIYDQTAGLTRFVINSSGVTTIAGDLIVGTIAKSGGTATQFLKADGTIDSSTYVTSATLANYLLSATAATTYQTLANLSTDLTASATKYPSVNAVVTGLGTKQPLDADLTAIAALVGTTGFLIKTAADTWSLDTNTYLTTASAASTYLTQTTAASTYQRLDKMVSNLLASSTEYPNSNAVLAKLALKADAANPVFTGDLSISGATPRLYFVDTDQNPDYTIFVDSGYFYIYDQTAGATKFQITPSGNAINTGTLTSTSFIKSGGTSSQFLMADGSVTTFSGVTGSGTASYLPKWTSGSAIGNSLMYDNGSSIGINTNTPFNGINNIGLNIERGGHSTLLLGNGYNYGGVVQSSDDIKRVFVGANIFDDPSNGWSQFIDGSGYAAVDVIGQGDGSSLVRLLNGSGNDSGYGGGNIFFESYKSNSNSYIKLRTNTDNAFYIFNSGNIGVNTTTDSGYKFDVNGTGRFSGQLNVDFRISLPGMTIGYWDSANNRIESGSRPLLITSYAQPIYIGQNGTANLTISTSGATTFSSSVTAGSSITATTTLGGASLNITGSQSTFRIASNYTGGGDLLSGTLLYIDDVVNNNLTIIPSSSGTSGSKIVAAAYTPGAWRSMWEFANVGSGNPNLILVKSGGNVLIGTTTDSGYKLDVNGTLKTSGDIFTTSTLKMSGNSSYNWMIQNYNDGNWGFGMFNSGSQYYPTVYFSGDGTNDRGFRVRNVNGGTNSFLVNSLGNGTFLGSVTATSFFESSDSRLKILIDGSAQIAGIENLEAKLYEKNGKLEFGYFAQDAQEFMPYSVEKNMDGFLSLSYREVHTAKIARLEQRVAELEKQLNAA